MARPVSSSARFVFAVKERGCLAVNLGANTILFFISLIKIRYWQDYIYVHKL